MLRWLLVLLLVPLVDAILLVVVAAEFLGAVATVALVVLTALLGMLLVRAEGRRTVRKIRRKLRTGELPADEAIDGGLLIAAGAFFLTPGLVTDALALLIAVPITRIPIRIAIKRFVIVPRLDDRTDGFVTGNVYTAGFPGDTVESDGGVGPDPGSPGDTDVGATGPSPEPETDADDGVYNLGEDAYQVDIDEDTDDESE